MDELSYLIHQHAFTIAITALAIAAFYLLSAYINRFKFPYEDAGLLLTNTERDFFKALEQAIDKEFYILYKVRLADLVIVPYILWNRGFHKKIATQHIDFVLVEKDTSLIRLCIELEDKSLPILKARKRKKWISRVLNKADLKLLHVKSYDPYDIDRLAQMISEKLNS